MESHHFHRMVQPRWMREYFALDPVPADWLGLGGSLLNGYMLKKDDLIWPMPAPLCMGFSWSLYFAQKANQHLMGNIPVSSRLFSDRSHPVVIKTGKDIEAQPSHHSVYVDNLGMLSTDIGALKEALTQVTEEFYAHGLDLHPGEVAQEGVDTLGCRVDGVKHRTSLKPSRVHKVRQALHGLLNRGKCSGRLLENLIGHLTYSFLMARPLLSIFDRTYKFIKRHYDMKVPLWPSVRDELSAALGGMIFCQADWTRKWNKVVSASDASLEGYGVCTAEWPLEIVKSVGRLQERERFRRAVGHSAREAALERARLGPSGIVDSHDANEAGWDIDEDFPEVPHEWLREERWDVKLKGKWKHAENIYELESLALLKSFSRLARGRYGKDSRQLLLVDHMAVALSFSRSRSKNRRVLQIIRKFSAWALGRNVACAVRWIPSELNAADKPSRSLSFKKDPDPLSPSKVESKPGQQGENFASLRGKQLKAGQLHHAMVTRESSRVSILDQLGEITEEKPRQKKRGRSTSSSSTTDPGSPEPAKGKQRVQTLARRQKRRLKKYLDKAFNANIRGTSLLEDEAVTAQVQRYYKKEVKQLLDFVKRQNLAFKEDKEIDAGIVKFMNRCFWLGEQAHKGEKLLAAFMHERPDFGRLGSRKLPRSWRALKGWRRLSRRPWLLMAVYTMVALSSDARPAELLRSTTYSLVPPVLLATAEWTLLLSPEHLGQPGKTGEYDLSVALDSSYLKPWSPTVFALLKKQPANTPLWGFNYGDYVAEFQKACKTLNFDLSPYQMRHSGPSIDRASNWRSPLEVQKRGGWKSAKSVTRYEKSARLGAAFLELPLRVRQHCQWCEEHLGDVILNRKSPLAPP